MTPDATHHATGRAPAPPLPDGSKNMNPPGLTFWALVQEDYRCHGSDFFSQGFWALFTNRLGNVRMDIRSRWLRLPLTLLYRLMRRACQVFGGIKLDQTVQVGRRVRLEHFGGMILGARAIGDDVIIRQNTTMGVRSVHDLNAKPSIGNRVDIGAGAVIVGNITIGDDCSVGANCVVSFDMPPGSRARSPRPEVQP